MKSNAISPKLKSGIVFTSTVLLSTLLSASALADGTKTPYANHSVGLTIGASGIGINASAKTNWHLTDNDQIQWRAMASGLEADFDGDDDVDLAGIDYDEGDFSLFALQGGLDWFPYHSGWAKKIFFSTGLIYANSDFDAQADMTKSFSVGNTLVSPGDITSLKTELESQQVLPYVSLGWGNKLDGKRGFDFQAELGLAIPTRDADVKLTAVDPGSFLSAADIANEKKDIEDDIDGLSAFGTLSVLYHF